MSWQPRPAQTTYRQPRPVGFDDRDVPSRSARSLSPQEREYERMEAVALELEAKLREQQLSMATSTVSKPTRKIELE